MNSSDSPDSLSESERYVVPNVRNAGKILLFLSERPGQRVIDVARTLELPQTTTLRILRTLKLDGFVEESAGRFALGTMSLRLGLTGLQQRELRPMALPFLQRLATNCHQTAHLAVLSGDSSLLVEVADSPNPVRAASRPGTLAYLHCSATGKTFLAFCKPESYLKEHKWIRRTSHTKTTAAALLKEIQLVRKQGYAVDDEEYHEGVRCVAAPVRDVSGAVVAAIGITGAAAQISKARLKRYAGLVMDEANELSASLGYNS